MENYSISRFKKKEKYILGCTPLLIHNGKKQKLFKENMIPMKNGEINPPSILGHGLENHARTAVGIKDNKIYLIIVESVENNSGCTLLDLQEIGIKLKLESFLNLDGGGSSQFKFKTESGWITNQVKEEDKNRTLGNVIVLFEEKLKIE